MMNVLASPGFRGGADAGDGGTTSTRGGAEVSHRAIGYQCPADSQLMSVLVTQSIKQVTGEPGRAEDVYRERPQQNETDEVMKFDEKRQCQETMGSLKIED